MADKAQIKKSIKDLQRIKTWQLVILLMLFGFIAATFLRLNNVGMIQRRDAVIVADQKGNELDTLNRLYELQRYVSGHMNTDLGQGVYLEHGYARDIEKWQQSQYGDSNPNGNIYKKAQEICAPQFSSWSHAYIQCTTNELAKYPSAEVSDGESGKPRQEAYVHSFYAPLWSPDFAGWSVLIFGAILLLIVIRLISLGVLKLLISRHYKRV